MNADRQDPQQSYHKRKHPARLCGIWRQHNQLIFTGLELRLCRSGSFEHKNIYMICRDPRLHFIHINFQQHRLMKSFAGEMFVRNTKLPLKIPKVKFSPQLLKPFIFRASLRLGKPEL